MNNQIVMWAEGIRHCRSCLSKYWLEFWHALALFSILLVLLFMAPVAKGIAVEGVTMFLFARMIYPLGKISKNQNLLLFSWVLGVIGIMIFLNLVLANYNAEAHGHSNVSLIQNLIQHYITF